MNPNDLSGTWTGIGNATNPALNKNNGVVNSITSTGTQLLIGGSFSNGSGVAYVASYDAVNDKWVGLTGSGTAFTSGDEVESVLVVPTVTLQSQTFNQ